MKTDNDLFKAHEHGNDGGAAWYGYWDGDEQKETIIYTI